MYEPMTWYPNMQIFWKARWGNAFAECWLGRRPAVMLDGERFRSACT